MSQQQGRRSFLQNDPIQVHNITPESTRQLVQRGLAALLETVEVKVAMTSSYTLEMINKRIRVLMDKQQDIHDCKGNANDEPTIVEEIEYLARIRERDFPDAD